MRIVVSGSRNITNISDVERILAGYIAVSDIVVTGGCRGVDQTAYDYAHRYFAKNEVHKADWDKHGKAAGPIRNKEMMKDAGLLVAFWDGKSSGTASAIKEARLARIETHIYYMDTENV